ncbi:MAG: O-antigen ligase family protein [Candidatus Schekmanbacteria bacterium]|nr:O-antigen ligase family protein [Candidatus Schekmanbacteria bacterium]
MNKSQPPLSRLLATAAYWLHVAAYVAIPLALSSATKETFLVPKDAVARLTLGPGLAFWIASAAMCRRCPRIAIPAGLPLLAFAGWAGLSCLWTPSPALALRDFLNLLLFVGSYFCLFDLLHDPEAGWWRRRVLLTACVCLGAATAAIGLLQFLGLQPFFFFDFVGNVDRKQIFSTFGNPNMLAEYLIQLIPLTLGVLSMTGAARQRWLASRAGALMLMMVILTGSRAAWLGVCASGVVFAMAGLWRRQSAMSRRRGLAFSGLLAACLVLAAVRFGSGQAVEPLSNRLTSIMSGGGQGGSSRLLEWLVSLDMLRDHPGIGLGLGSFQTEFLDYRGQFFANGAHPEFLETIAAANAKHSHNELIQVGAELGLVGLGIAAWLLVDLALSLIRRLRQLAGEAEGGAESIREWLLLRASAAGLAAILVAAQFAFPFHLAAPAGLSLLLLAVAGTAGVARRKDGAPEATGDPEPAVGHGGGGALAWVAVAGGAVLAITSCVIGVQTFRAEVLLKRTEKALLTNTDIDQAEYLATTGLAANPTDGRLHFMLALTLQNKGEAAARAGNREKSVAAYRRAVAEYELAGRYFGDVAIPANTGQCYTGLGNFPAAREALMVAIAMDPTSLPVLRALAVNETVTGNYDGALDWIRKALTQDGSDEAMRLMLHRIQGERALSQGHPEEAEKYFAHAVELAPADGAGLLGLARAKAAQGDLEGARAILERVVAASPGWPVAHSVLASVEASLGNLDRAEQHVRIVLRAAPHDKRAQQMLEVISRRRALAEKP